MLYRQIFLPLLHNSSGGGGHALDGHVHISVPVADGYAEPAEVGPDDLDPVVGGAGEVEGLPLAPVLGLVPRTVRSNAWNRNKVSDDEDYGVWFGNY